MAKRKINVNGTEVIFNNVKNVSKKNQSTIKHYGIISARNIADMSAENACDFAKKYLETVDNNLFNVAVLCGYAVGIRIPAYVEASGNKVEGLFIEKPLKQSEMVERIGKDKSVVSRWIKALNYIIDNNMFSAFAQGMLPFSTEKIIAYYETFKAKGFLLKDVMGWSTANLRKAEKEAKETAKAKNIAKKEEAGISADVLEPEKLKKNTKKPATVATFVYEGLTYKVDKALIEEFIKNNCVNTLTA